jgi:hypothetical protein
MELLQELWIGFADTFYIIHFVACNQQRHNHAVVGVRTVFGHGTQAVGFFQWQRLNACGV